jgi:poly(hydroxyalkanoate) depolymerase family esterase
MKKIAKAAYVTKPMVFFVYFLALVYGPCSIAYSGEFKEVTSFGSNPGSLNMYKFVPDNMPENAPLVVSLHGCKQSATIYSDSGWKEVAEHFKFYVLLPEQTSGNNMNSCFNWFEPADTKRDHGESKSIRSMIDTMLSSHSIDRGRIFVEGLSAGGYMAAIMLASYPDLFKGGAINAGGPSYCASNLLDAFSCMGGVEHSPESWGRLVRKQGYSGYTGPWPKVSIWHGTEDGTVSPVNQRGLVDQWTNVHGIDREVDKADTVRGYPHKEYHDDQGNVMVETYSITGMGHATPIDAGFAETDGCGRASSYIKDENICSVYYMARFWGLDKQDNTPPEVKIISPQKDETVSGVVNVSVSTSDNEGVVKMQFLVGNSVRREVFSEPFGFDWDSSNEENGTRMLVARAYDKAGNRAEDVVDVTVEGGRPDTTPCIVSADPDGGTFQKTVTVTLNVNEQASIYFTTDGSPPDTTSDKYKEPLTFTESTPLSFFCKDLAGNESTPLDAVYNIPRFDAVEYDTSTMHYNANRLTLDNYLRAGEIYGYINAFNLYRFDDCWTDDASGSGKLGACTGEGSTADCQEWTDTNKNHEKNGRAKSNWHYSFPLGFSSYYYAQGSNDDLGRGADETTLQKKDPGNDYYNRGSCGQ